MLDSDCYLLDSNPCLLDSNYYVLDSNYCVSLEYRQLKHPNMPSIVSRIGHLLTYETIPVRLIDIYGTHYESRLRKS